MKLPFSELRSYALLALAIVAAFLWGWFARGGFIEEHQAPSFVGSPPTADNELQRMGTPVVLPEDFETLWAKFSLEFDWMVLGGTRQRFIDEHGERYWKQVINIDPGLAVANASQLDSWKMMLRYGNENPEDIKREMKSIYLASKGNLSDRWIEEADMFPFLCLVLAGNDLQEHLNFYPGLRLMEDSSAKELRMTSIRRCLGIEDKQ